MGFSYSGHSNSMINGKLIALRPGLTIIILKVTPDHRRLTTNLPFSEWTQVFTNARLCRALLDRITDRATIIETGKESFRFRRTLGRKKH